jgi:hypothetical protein
MVNPHALIKVNLSRKEGDESDGEDYYHRTDWLSDESVAKPMGGESLCCKKYTESLQTLFTGCCVARGGQKWIGFYVEQRV